MSRNYRFLVVAFVLIAFVAGSCIGFIWSDLPYVKFNNEIKIYEVFNLLLTIGIGLSVPFLLKKWIEDNRPVKTALAEEVKILLNYFDEIKSSMTVFHVNKSITQADKDKINYKFHQAELKIDSLAGQLDVSFSSQSKAMIADLREKYHVYKDFLTGGELMLSNFITVDDRFYREHNNALAKLDTHLKTLIHKIHKL